MALNHSVSALSKSLRLASRKTLRQQRSSSPTTQYSVLEPRQLLATISWSTSVDIENTGTFVDNSTGSLVAAINADNAGDDALINGVNFEGTDVAGWNSGVTGVGGVTISSNATNGNFGNTFVEGSGSPVGITNGGDIDNLVSSGIWNPQTVTLDGLTPGDTYFIQVIGNDSRDGRTDSYVTLLGDGTGTSNFTGRNILSNSVAGGPGNLPGSAISGTFVADASSQTFEVSGELNGNQNNGRAQINALQLRKSGATGLLPGAVPLINEFSASNSSVLDDDNGNSSDWIEIYNAGQNAVNLGGYSLTDDPANTIKYVIPSNTSLGGGEYLIVFAGDDANPASGSDLYTGFGLSAGGEYLGFFDSAGGLVSEFGANGADYPAQFSDVSYGVENDGTFSVSSFFETPTPGFANGFDAVDGVIDTLPTVSVERGFYDQAFTVNVTSQAPGAILVYTTDGTQPSLTNGIQIQPASSTALASTNILIDTTTSLRTGSFKPNFFTREFSTHSYVFLNDVLTSDVLNYPQALDPYTNQELRDALLDLPTVSFNFDNEIQNSGTPEQRASIEWLEDGNIEEFQLDAGITAFGGAFTDFDKKNFRLHFRSEYGASKLEFPLFEGFDDGVTPATETFDQLEFRSGSHDRNGRGFGLSNRFVDETLLDAGHNVPHGRFVHLYINGEYWGQYHMRERWNDDFLASYYGGDEENYEAINGNINNGNSTPNGWSPGDVFDGSGVAWSNINDIVNDNSLSSSQRYAALQQTVDLDQYVDYMLVWMAGQAENEYRSGGSTDGLVPYTFYLNDADGWLRDPVDGSGGQAGDKTGNAGPANILGKLVSEANPEFMTYYADRIQNMFYNDGPLSTAQSTARLQEIIDQVDQSVILESARWSFSGEPNGGGSLTVAQFESKSQQALNDFLPHILDPPANRDDPRDIIERFQDRGVFPDVVAPEHLIDGVIQNGGAISAGAALTLSAAAPIYFTVDGSDPRLPGGGVNPNAILVSASTSVTLTSSTNVRSRAFSNGEWSAINDATFDLPVTQAEVRISEIYYNPSDISTTEIAAGFDDNDQFEFLEIFNPNPIGTINLSGLELVSGVTFSFPDVELGPGERAVVVENAAAFRFRYGNDVNILGEWSGGLSNGGEDLELVDANLNEIMSVNYGDNDPWYIPSDGHGFSIVLDQPASTPFAELGKYYSWRASTELGGTPGDASAAPLGIVVNEVLAHTDAPQSDTIELFNPTGSSIDVSGWYLSDEGDELLKFQIPAGTVIAAGGYLVFDEQDFNPTPATPGPNDFALSSSSGDQVYLSRASAGTFVALEDAVEFDATFNGESLGRLPNGTGRLVRLASNSFGSVNGAHALSDVIISEVNYHPETPNAAALAIDPLLIDSDLEFIEISNASGSTIDLTNWSLRGESDFDFASGTMLTAGSSLAVISFDPSDPLNATRLNAFMAHYGLTSSANLVGGFSGSLSNSTGRIALQQPDAPELTFVPGVVVDEVVYDDLSPWANADGSGDSLNRDGLVSLGTSASSWLASTPTPGVADIGIGRGVVDLIVGGTGFSPEFVDAVDGGGIGAGNDLGYSLAGGHQLETLPWSGIDTLYLEFTGDVSATLTSGSVLLTGTNGGSYSLGTITVDSNNIATIPVIGGIASDSLVLTIFDNTVSTSSGTVIGGSGGGQFDYFFNVLVGDENASDQVNSSDAFAVFASNTDAVTESNFRRDIDGSGQINSTDAFAAFANNTNGLPAVPTPPSPPAPVLSSPITITESFSAVAAFTESDLAIAATPVTSEPASVVSLVPSFETESVKTDSVETEPAIGSTIATVADSTPELTLVGSSSAASSLSNYSGFEIADYDEDPASLEVRDNLFGDLENSELLPELL